MPAFPPLPGRGVLDLNAASIRDPALRESYLQCRSLHARYGRTYFLATLMLPPAKRPYVHALYGLARYADELVDGPAPEPGRLESWSWAVLADLAAGSSTDPIAAAAAHTAARWGIPAEHFAAFFESMLMDAHVSCYPTMADLDRYMHGSAAVIGLQMLPILEPSHWHAAEPAAELGRAFQMTNFIRDVAEDLRRGRVYLPQEDLDRFGVTRDDLAQPFASGRVRELVRWEVGRARAMYRAAEPGVALLHPTSRDCIHTALVLYEGILDQVENAHYDVLRGRVRVPTHRRLAVALPGYVRAWRSRSSNARGLKTRGRSPLHTRPGRSSSGSTVSRS